MTYAERISRSDMDVDDALFDDIHREFGTPEPIVELTAIVAFENMRSKFNHALLVESNGVCMLPGAPTPP